jgi:phospholysine phosphohistidine inorganic pyrophosphate phosphatase
VRGVLLDLDGVVYVGDSVVPGAAEVVDWLTQEDIPFRFLTNTSSRPRSSIVEKLSGMGIHASDDDMLTPAVAAKSWLKEHSPGRPALFVPEATASELAELDPLPDDVEEGAGAVVVGDLGEGWDFATFNRAFRLLMDEPRPALVALGMTRYWKADDGLRLDAGAFVRALEYAVGTTAVVMGKPDPAFYRTAIDGLGLAAGGVVMIGDDIRSDVEGAQRAGLTGILVRTGKFAPADLDGNVAPDAVLDSIADLPNWWTSAG